MSRWYEYKIFYVQFRYFDYLIWICFFRKKNINYHYSLIYSTPN